VQASTPRQSGFPARFSVLHCDVMDRGEPVKLAAVRNIFLGTATIALNSVAKLPLDGH